MDYPDSDDDGAAAAEGAAILDDDEAEQTEDIGGGAMDHDHGDNRREPDGAGGSQRAGPSTGSSYTSCGGHPTDGPELPPIYRTVKKEREKRMVVRHLYGGAPTEAVCTDSGVTVSQVETVGSFANTGDKRHNHTMHIFDFKHARNISTSFNTSTLTCTTCQGEHMVLRREIEGADVGMDSPPIFVLADQNFPPMIPAGGGRRW
jgi:hypothetical protein